MSQTKGIKGVLLPHARVDVFTVSDKTLEVFKTLQEDWRFSRVEMTIEKAGFDAAIARYEAADSPDLVILGTEETGDDFVAQLNVLASHCQQGTEAIVLGPENDVQLYRRLIDMGVRDYLVRPIDVDDMAKVISKAVLDKKGIEDSRLIVSFGVRGGVGATSVAQILADISAETYTEKTVLIDACAGRSTLGVVYGVRASVGFSEAVRLIAEGSDDDLARVLTPVHDALDLIMLGEGDVLKNDIAADVFESCIDRLMKIYPNVVVDLSGAPLAVQDRLIDRAHHIFVVSTPELTSLRLARSYLETMKARHKEAEDLVKLVINKKGFMGSREINVKDIEAALEYKPAAVIPFAPDVFGGAESSETSLQKIKGGESIVKALMPLMDKILVQKDGGSLEDKASKGGLFGSIFSAFKS